MPPLYLDESEQVPLPPSGTRIIFVDTDGLTKELTSSGEKIPLGLPIGAGGAWALEQYQLINSLIPGLTYQHIKAGQVPQGGAVPSTNDGVAEGGGRTGTNATFMFISASVFQAANTASGAFAFRVKFLAAAAAQTNAVGLANAAATHDMLVGAINSISATNYSLSADGTTSTTDDLAVANDLGWHTFVVTFDTANIKVYVDGTLRATRAIGTNVVDEPLYLCTYNTLTTETVWSECLYAYVAP